ncbi:MAG: hypothetical protein J0H92_11460 [Sphingobacteriales bacterium]|nr:hypothetical protein [Sphingobacteriales bacterium]OJW31561.1 MAG: hypothetical protein BGO54_13955 [Sphingobacteriales bacterium 46-32]
MKIFITMLAMTACLNSMAQKETFDIVSYIPPTGWTPQTGTGYMAYSKVNDSQWGQLAIYKSTASKGDIESDSQHEWQALVLALRAIENDEKTAPRELNGWTVVSRSGTWKYNGADVATILTTFSDGKTCVSLLCNATTELYLKEFLQLIESIELIRPLKSEASLPAAANTAATHTTGIVGLWGTYNTETSGFMNGTPMTTGGYFRKEYLFYGDGTYLYRAKDWSAFVKDIRFVYETGKYELKDNQLTLIPAKGKGEWWSKAASGRTSEWGSRIKTFTPLLEKITYAFEVRYLSGMERPYLYLRHGKPTARDGSQSNQENVLHEFSYGKRNQSEEALIDTPPGTKTGMEGKK